MFVEDPSGITIELNFPAAEAADFNKELNKQRKGKSKTKAQDLMPKTAVKVGELWTPSRSVLEEYAATVEGALNLESQAPFQYGGLAIQDALSKIETSLEKLEKGGRSEPNVQEAPEASQDDCELA